MFAFSLTPFFDSYEVYVIGSIKKVMTVCKSIYRYTDKCCRTILLATFGGRTDSVAYLDMSSGELLFGSTSFNTKGIIKIERISGHLLLLVNVVRLIVSLSYIFIAN